MVKYHEEGNSWKSSLFWFMVPGGEESIMGEGVEGGS